MNGRERVRGQKRRVFVKQSRAGNSSTRRPLARGRLGRLCRLRIDVAPREVQMPNTARAARPGCLADAATWRSHAQAMSTRSSSDGSAGRGDRAGGARPRARLCERAARGAARKEVFRSEA